MTKLLVLLLAIVCLFGCSKSQQQATKSIEQAQTESSIIPCDTDSDCEEKNNKRFTCDAFTRKGTRCKRVVSEEGLVCWQHSREMNKNPVEYAKRQAKFMK